MSESQVKRFVAPSMTRALELVQRELGPEAVILSSRKVDKGVEIVTSLEPDLPTRGIDVRREFGQHFDAELDRAMPSDNAWRSQAGIERAAEQFGEQAEPGNRPRSGEELAREIEAAREKMLAAKRREREKLQASNERPALERKGRTQSQSHRDASPPVPELSPTADELRLSELQTEIADMRMLLEQQLWRAPEQFQGMSSIPAQVKMPGHFAALTQRLRRLGLSDSLVESLNASISEQSHISAAWRQCMHHLCRQIPIKKNFALDKPGVYAFLGQTGVGKTTTIAKLAAQYVLKHGPGKVALVTTDTFRVGAFDQLRTMGRILNVPVRVVDRDNSLLTVLSSLRKFPLVLIDTAGFRLGDPLLKAQLDQLDQCLHVQRVLVLSCNSQWASMKASVHAHRGQRDLAACVLTKLDESVSLGEALSLVVQERIPVAYTTDGQDIPKDLADASGAQLVSAAVRVLKESYSLAQSAQ